LTLRDTSPNTYPVFAVYRTSVVVHAVWAHTLHVLSTYLATWRGRNKTLFLINELVG